MSTATQASETSLSETDITAGRAALEADAVSFDYGDRRALDSVSFSITEREIFGFLGPNGGGKTTLFKILSTLAHPQSGNVRVFGRALADDTRETRRKLGVVFQNPSLDGKLTVLENLKHHGHLFGMSGAGLRARSDEMLARLGLSDRANDIADKLSGGLKRRAEIAKALLHGPRLLILDEPSTGLDPGARRDFSDYIVRLRDEAGVTIVLTTHYLEEAERCDRVGILDRGRLIAVAPPRELKERVGGDVVIIHSGEPEALARRIEQRIEIKAAVVGGVIRIEGPRGLELVRRVMEEFGGEIESVSFGRPTLEDAFIRLTGHKFFAEMEDEAR